MSERLRRALGLGHLTVYAVGDILGAGIYALVGKVVQLSGSDAWLAFIVSGLLATLTGLTYAELSSRYPLAGGASAYCARIFGRTTAFVAGILVLASGIVSAATVARAFIGYLSVFLPLPHLPAALGLLLLMSLVNHAGIRESSRVNITLTLIEIGGLVLVITAGLLTVSDLPLERVQHRLRPSWDLPAIIAGSTLAFYSYIGFEDTANVAEEVRNPQRILPRAILLAIFLTCLLYTAVVLVALAVVPGVRLAASETPLLEVLNLSPFPIPPALFSAIALCAVTNTGLLNLIMASRLLYGMAAEGLLPAVCARIDPKRRTPWVAIWLAFILASALAATGETRLLAQTTSLLLLWVFGLLHAGLLLLHRRPRPPGIFHTPNWVPTVGLIVCLAIVTQYPPAAWLRASAILLAALLLRLFFRGRKIFHML